MADADIIVVGAGLAGLVAAAEAADAGRSVVVVDQEGAASLGGQAWWSLGGLLIIVLDAYVDAQLYEFNEDPVPVPPLTEPAPPPALSQASSGPPAGTVLFRWQTAF